MTEYERMLAGLVYDPMDPEIAAEQTKYLDGLWAFNQLRPSETEAKQRYMKEVFAECGERCWIELPFRANWGGAHVHFGDDVYANFNLTLVDDGHIYIGSRTLLGANVTVATPNHPLDPERRGRGLQYNRDVRIGENVWVGSGAIILAGVTIGDNTVIGAGSVVTRDIPSGVLALGVPCRVVREIGPEDAAYLRDE